MNLALLEHGSQPNRHPAYDKKAKEARMSRLSSGHSANREMRTQRRNNWLHLALGLQTSALAICCAVGCNSVGGQGLLKNSLHQSHIPNATAPAAMSLRDDVRLVPATQPRREIAHVSYNEPVSPSIPITGLVAPHATQASYQVASGCSPTCGSGCNCGLASETVCAPNSNQDILNVQEYLFDGGDLDPALVVRKDQSVAGLNPTDTVAYYETYDGKLCVTPTNRVPIYAPRFGAIRQVTGVVLSEHALATERILAPVSASRFEDKNLVSSMMQPVAPHGEEKVSLIDAFRDRNGGVPLAQVFPPHRMSDAIVPFEAIDFFRTGILKAEDIPVLGQFLQNAKTWETPESLEVLID
jgi:hypothetical protein